MQTMLKIEVTNGSAILKIHHNGSYLILSGNRKLQSFET